MTRVPSPRRRGAPSFTLIELLVVVAILSLLAALSIPAFRSVSAASSLGAAKQVVTAELDLARQTAISRSVGVEVRFYQLPAYGAPSTAAPAAFRAVQTFVQDAAATNALDKIAYFPKPALAAALATASPLLQSPAAGTFRLPEIGTNYRYVSVFFAPGGAVQGLTAANSFLTLVLDKAPIQTANLPANFVTIQIDPVDGRVFTYAP